MVDQQGGLSHGIDCSSDIALRRLASQPMPAYDLTTPYSPKGDQPTAIKQLVQGV